MPLQHLPCHRGGELTGQPCSLAAPNQAGPPIHRLIVPQDLRRQSPGMKKTHRHPQLLHLQDVGPLFRRPDLGAVTFEVRRFAPRRASSVLRGHGQSGTTVLHAPSKDVLKYSYLLNHKHCTQLRALRHLRAFYLFLFRSLIVAWSAACMLVAAHPSCNTCK